MANASLNACLVGAVGPVGIPALFAGTLGTLWLIVKPVFPTPFPGVTVRVAVPNAG